MSEQLTDIEEAFARLTMLEFALEVVMANQLSECGQASSDVAKAKFINTSKKPVGPMTGDMATARRMQMIVDRSVQMAEKFISKVARREAEIRREKTQGT